MKSPIPFEVRLLRFFVFVAKWLTIVLAALTVITFVVLLAYLVSGSEFFPMLTVLGFGVWAVSIALVWAVLSALYRASLNHD